MSVEGFRSVSTWLRPAGWSKQCQDWTLQTPWAHQFRPSWLAGMSHLLQACLALNQHPTLPPLASRLAQRPSFPGLSRRRSARHPGLSVTRLSNDRYEVLRLLGRFLAITNFTDQFSRSHLLILPGSQSFVNLNKRESCLLKSLAAWRVHFRRNSICVASSGGAKSVGLPSLSRYSESHILRVKCPASTLGFHPRASSWPKCRRGPAQQVPPRRSPGGWELGDKNSGFFLPLGGPGKQLVTLRFLGDTEPLSVSRNPPPPVLFYLFFIEG